MKMPDKDMDTMADNLENYLDMVERFIIITGITKSQYDKSVKKVKKLIKNLRKHKSDKCFDKDRLREAIEEGRIDLDYGN